MSRKLDDLCPRFREHAFEVIARCASAHVWLIVVDTLRTLEEQKRYLKTGASKTLNSLHLPQTQCPYCKEFGGLSHAMDAAPILDLNATSTVAAIQWDTHHPSWHIYGKIAKSLDLVWGGDWKSFPDFSHIQMPRTTREVAE